MEFEKCQAEALFINVQVLQWCKLSFEAGRALSSHANVVYMVLNFISVPHKVLQIASDFACQLTSLPRQRKCFIPEG